MFLCRFCAFPCSFNSSSLEWRLIALLAAFVESCHLLFFLGLLGRYLFYRDVFGVRIHSVEGLCQIAEAPIRSRRRR